MVDFAYVPRGLLAMSRAFRAGGMSGHLGSGVLAGYFFGEMHPGAEPGVYLGVERDLERIMAGEESIWFDPAKAGITIPEMFAGAGEEPVGEPIAGEVVTSRIAEALEKSIARLRQSGHNVIFASIALRGLRDHPEFATEPIVSGIEKLLATFETTGGGRGFFGEATGWKSAGEVDLTGVEAPACSGLDEVAEVAVGELIADAAKRTRGFGGLIHLLDHAAALVELEGAGLGDLAELGIPAFRQHVRLLRSLPVLEEEGPLQKADEDPLTAAYWLRRESVQYSAWLTHRVKVLYGFGILLPSIEDAAKRERAEEAFRYLLA